MSKQKVKVEFRNDGWVSMETTITVPEFDENGKPINYTKPETMVFEDADGNLIAEMRMDDEEE